MSLMAALAILGALLLAGVVLHGAWSARQALPRRADPQHPPRVDPTLVGGATPQPTPEAMTAPLLRRAARLDALIDAIAPLTLEAPISGELALAHLPPSRRAGTKPFLIEGLDTDSGAWDSPQPGHRYGEFQAGVQMANRSGSLNEIEYSEFVQKVQTFADAIGAMAEPPDMLDAVARARELDAFASQHDGQLALTLKARAAAWTIAYLQQSAARQGFVAGAVPGRLVLPASEDGAPPVLVLGFDAQAALAEDAHIAAVREVTLLLDVPQSPEAAEPFPAWHRAAHALAADMDADIVDDQGRAVALHAFAAIGQDLQRLYRALESRDLAAGSAAARRLFS